MRESNFIPLYSKVKEDLARKIRGGQYRPNQQLPTVVDLAEGYAVSDGTIKRTLRELTQEGLIYTVNGKGIFTSDLEAAASLQQAEAPPVAVLYGRRQNEMVGNLFYSGILHGVERELNEHGVGLELINLRNRPVSDLIKARQRGRFPAVLLLSALRRDDLLTFAACGRCTVSVLNEYGAAAGVYCLGSDEVAGGSAAARHLLAQGCRRIGAIIVPQTSTYAEQRWQGFRSALESACGALDEDCIEPADWSMEGGYLATRQLLQRRPDLDGLFTMNDLMAFGAIGAACESGRQVPEDLKVIGYDDIDFARYFRPGLSTIRVDRERLGRRAASILLQGMERAFAGFEVERIEPRLVARKSTSADDR